MVDLTSAEKRNEVLKQEIDRLHSEILLIKSSQLQLRKESSYSKKRLRYLKLAKGFRAPANSYQFWRIGALLVGPLSVGVLSLIIAVALTDSISFGICGAILGAILTIAIIATLLVYPSDSRLHLKIDQTVAEIQSAEERVERLDGTDGLIGIETRLKDLLKEHFELKERMLIALAEINQEQEAANLVRKLQRQLILRRDWKAMRGYEWELYLVNVFNALGVRVEQIGGAGDQGVDLIVEYEKMRIAVQAKGYDGAVNNKAVQEAFAGMVHHCCTACAVITNSWFQPSASILAKSTNCILISGDEFPDFVMGNLDLAVLANEIRNLRTEM